METAKKHLIIIGFMGTGKTTAGQQLAAQINLPWVDTDQQIEQKWGFSVAEYFQRYGEASFREQETDVLQQLLSGPPSLITTGGGIVLKPENRAMMKEQGWVIHLYATPEEIIRRLSANRDRPLLQGDIRQKVRQLFRERDGKYDFADCTINTTSCSPDDVVEKILSFWQRRQV
ncbi:shikimate kinase [Paenactinomyces guangxiensis]|uniref:Shikimate kinase n=1 Tax=Paenactinomyces guangxiensis TaxID=1490290 RepID=A0A7W1WP02_9BACL|nr:shikimate kinase [Paenactinomyces guangxiensis]MBA4493274.1 shikimate kinase [Paenactinomyces guangxiensis]MBH8589875.1 shikimate kinase [Paenactinomyces guangxiensis]